MAFGSASWSPASVIVSLARSLALEEGFFPLPLPLPFSSSASLIEMATWLDSLTISTKGMATGTTVGYSEASVVSTGIFRISGGKKTFSDNLKAKSAGIPAALRA